ncbi:MAG: hypothetical protein GWO02_14520, partial [Gammaproteobacteria bacterium]|nr:hypothetical protein [Gammaproteobacteria bacterium]
MWVVKVGGSLARCASLGRWIDVLATEGAGRVVLVPGGGVFADAVREAQARWGFNDVTAHRMAVLAMEQTGLMLAGLRGDLVPAATPLELTDALDRRRV